MKHQTNAVVSRSKYKQQNVVVNGQTFKNKASADRYYELRCLQLINVVSSITLNAQFVVNGQVHIADFVYFHKEIGQEIAEFVRKNKTKNLLGAIEALSNAYKNIEFRIVA